MKIEDVEVGTEVKLLATLFTDVKLGYHEDDMLSVGDYGEVVCIDYEDSSVKLSDGFWYSVKDLKPYKEPYTESRQNTNIGNDNIGNLTVSISSEDKEEIAKDILKIVLKDFNKVITDAIAQLDDDDNKDEVNNVDQFSDQKFFDMLQQALKETLLNPLNK